MAKITKIKLDVQSGTTTTVYATWEWTKAHTDHYVVKWYYATGDGVWFVGSSEELTVKQATYNAPSNATKVKFVVKPYAEKHKVKKKKVAYWSADWSTAKVYSFTSNPPVTPSVPAVSLNNLKLTAEVDDYSSVNTVIEFYVTKNDSSKFTSGKATKKKDHAEFTCDVTAGNEYKVRCRSWDGKEYSDWSNYSSNVATIPATPSKITSCKAASTTSIEMVWESVKNATTYTVEYTSKKSYFDTTGSVSSVSIDATAAHSAIITGLDSGNEWFFRVKAVNSNGSSGWSPIASSVVGKVPAAPTTWSLATVAKLGDTVPLYWVHNSQDGSSPTYAELELNIQGKTCLKTIQNSTEEDEKDKTSVYNLDTSLPIPCQVGGAVQAITLEDGGSVTWRVRTKGVVDEYGDWSVMRTLDIYAPPTLELSSTNLEDGILSSFPLILSAIAGPNTQTPTGYKVTVMANDSYEDIDDTGKTVYVNSGNEVFSGRYSGVDEDNVLATLSADNINLANNVAYTLVCIVTMNSGLTATQTLDFDVAWVENEYEPNAEIGIDDDAVVAYIRPYCEDKFGAPIPNTELSVHRREFDGKFTKIYDELSNYVFEENPLVDSYGNHITDSSNSVIETACYLSNQMYITDPHPALDYARYRIVGKDIGTGFISYYDCPPYPVDEDAAIIQWDEDWSTFDGDSEDETETPSWTGSLLRLRYNLDVSYAYSPDVSNVEYIGREHPVSYYGTQLGETETWSFEVPYDDIDTIYALRRLAVYMGDVYVREPGGSGYWASVTVSFSKTHCELTIPVSIEITRVNGGV